MFFWRPAVSCLSMRTVHKGRQQATIAGRRPPAARGLERCGALPRQGCVRRRRRGAAGAVPGGGTSSGAVAGAGHGCVGVGARGLWRHLRPAACASMGVLWVGCVCGTQGLPVQRRADVMIVRPLASPEVRRAVQHTHHSPCLPRALTRASACSGTAGHDGCGAGAAALLDGCAHGGARGGGQNAEGGRRSGCCCRR
jgi:hypothetical protein